MRRTPAPGAARASRVAFPTSSNGAITVSWRTVVVLLVVAFSFVLVAPTLRVYLRQQEQERAVTAEFEYTTARNEQLQHEIDRWADDDYVRAQARERLGYVLPGQQPYIVVDPETVVGEEAQTEYEQAMGYVPPSGPWYLEMWESIRVAGATELGEAAADGGRPEGATP